MNRKGYAIAAGGSFLALGAAAQGRKREPRAGAQSSSHTSVEAGKTEAHASAKHHRRATSASAPERARKWVVWRVARRSTQL